jgi:hypothetical protein
VPTITSRPISAGCRAAASRPISEPMLWPTSVTWPSRCTPAAASKASSQSAVASTLGSTGPALCPWPGRSSASTPYPWWAHQRDSRVHTLWSCSAPWMKTTQGRAGSKGLPPV